jgi:hypothetical protein
MFKVGGGISIWNKKVARKLLYTAIYGRRKDTNDSNGKLRMTQTENYG